MMEWILSSSVLIVMVIAIRCLFRYKMSMRMRYALWLAVALRLLIPVSFWESSFSVLNLLKAEDAAAWQEGIAKQPDTDWEQGDAAPAESTGAPGELADMKNGDGIGMSVGSGNYDGLETSGNKEDGNSTPTSGSEGNHDGLEMSGDRENGNDLQTSGGEENNNGLNVPGSRENGSSLQTSGGKGNGNGAEVYDGKENGSGLQMSDGKGNNSDLEASGNGKTGSLFFVIWAVGMALCAAVALRMNISYRNRVYRSRKQYTDRKGSGLPVYISPVVNTPCMFGVLHPAIYLTPKATEADNSLKYILCHENTHYRHKDNIWALVRVVCTCVHWYNPLVWLAAYLSRQDCELACDEETLEILGEKERIPYGRALLEFSVQSSMLVGDFRLSTTISGGKKQLKERLLVIAQRPEKYAVAVVMVIFLEIFLLLATFTGRKDTPGLEQEGFLNNGSMWGDGVIGVGLDFTANDGLGGNPGSGTENGVGNSGSDAGNRVNGGATGNGSINSNSNSLGENQPGMEYYTEEIPVNLNDGEEYILRIGGETAAESGECRINQLELCKISDSGEEKEEVLQSIHLKDLKVLYTRPGSATKPYTDSISSIWQFSTDKEALFAKPLCTSADLPAHAVGLFLEDGGEPILSGLRNGGIFMMDLNFDGYDDLCLPVDSGSENVPHYCFLWNPEEKQFQYSYMIPNVRADEATHLVESRTSDGGGVYSKKYYSFDEENRLHLVRYVEENQSKDAIFPVLDLTYCETTYCLPAVDEWDYGTEYGGALTERMVYWAKQALTELYEWSGTKIDTVCFAVTEYGGVSFGNTREDLKASRNFYDRRYGAEGGFVNCIASMDLVTERVVWFSPVTQWNVPEELGSMTDMQVVEWYFARSPLAKGEELDTIEESFENVYVIGAKSGNYYELTLDVTTREVDSVYGPYESYPAH